MADPCPPSRPQSNRSSLRAWQIRALAAMEHWESGPFLISAAPGRARPGLHSSSRAGSSQAGTATAVVVACPTAPLTRQWARAAHDLGLDLAPDAGSPAPPAGFHGVSVTYARVAKAPLRWARSLPRRTLVIADEAHHLGEELTWGMSFAKAFAESPAVAAALRHPVSLRRHADPGRQL